jgi:hypothetical protein
VPLTGESSPEQIFRMEADQTDFREQCWFMQWSETLEATITTSGSDASVPAVVRFTGRSAGRGDG